MTAARRFAAILVADVGVREHRGGASENRANGSCPPKQSPAARGRRAGGDKVEAPAGRGCDQARLSEHADSEAIRRRPGL